MSVAGIDVGGTKKGFHAVALDGERLTTFRSPSAAEIAHWCDEVNAVCVGIDAPCSWSRQGTGRPCERELAADRISCFLTPTLEAARAHPKNYYGWMLAGEALYRELLGRGWALHDGGPGSRRVMFETYPYAIERVLGGSPRREGSNVAARRRLLDQHGVDSSLLTNADFVDAGLCAVTAGEFSRGRVRSYGDGESGMIVVPLLRS